MQQIIVKICLFSSMTAMGAIGQADTLTCVETISGQSLATIHDHVPDANHATLQWSDGRTTLADLQESQSTRNAGCFVTVTAEKKISYFYASGFNLKATYTYGKYRCAGSEDGSLQTFTGIMYAPSRLINNPGTNVTCTVLNEAP